MTTKPSELVSISTFRSIADAQIAKGILDEAGIESMIRSDNAGGMYPAIDGAYLVVRAEDVEKAREALLKAESLDPNNRETEYGLALAYSKLGDREEAKIHMDRFQKGRTPSEKK